MQDDVPQTSSATDDLPCGVDQVIQTYLLHQRPSKAANHAAEDAAIHGICKKPRPFEIQATCESTNA
jgi:hypothetical protein